MIRFVRSLFDCVFGRNERNLRKHLSNQRSGLMEIERQLSGQLKMRLRQGRRS